MSSVVQTHSLARGQLLVSLYLLPSSLRTVDFQYALHKPLLDLLYQFKSLGRAQSVQSEHHQYLGHGRRKEKWHATARLRTSNVHCSVPAVCRCIQLLDEQLSTCDDQLSTHHHQTHLNWPISLLPTPKNLEVDEVETRIVRWRSTVAGIELVHSILGQEMLVTSSASQMLPPRHPRNLQRLLMRWIYMQSQPLPSHTMITALYPRINICCKAMSCHRSCNSKRHMLDENPWTALIWPYHTTYHQYQDTVQLT